MYLKTYKKLINSIPRSKDNNNVKIDTYFTNDGMVVVLLTSKIKFYIDKKERKSFIKFARIYSKYLEKDKERIV